MTTIEKINEMTVFIKQSFIAQKLKLSDTGFWKKIKGKSSFKEEEIQEIERLYKIFKKM